MFVKAKDKRLYEDVVTQIRQLIETGQLKAGDMLPSEGELSGRIGVGRSTVREGLRILELMGFIETKRGKGTQVRVDALSHFKGKLADALDMNSRSDWFYLHEIDKLIEPGVARLAAEKADEPAILRLKLALDKMEEALDNGESGEAESLYFHRCIIDIVGNPYLSAMYESTRNLHERGRALMATIPGRPRQTLREHYKIYDAIRGGDGRMANKYMGEHLRKVGEAQGAIVGLMDRDILPAT